MLIHYFSLHKTLDEIQTKSFYILTNLEENPAILQSQLDNLNVLITSITLVQLTSCPYYSKMILHMSYALNYSHLIEQNIKDILLNDIPNLRPILDKYFYDTLDSELFDETKDLFSTNYSSAIQRAFIILTSRIRNSEYVTNTSLDGTQLCDHLFSDISTISFKDKTSLNEYQKRYFKKYLYLCCR